MEKKKKRERNKTMKGYSLKSTNGTSGSYYVYVWKKEASEAGANEKGWHSLGNWEQFFEGSEKMQELKRHLYQTYGKDDETEENILNHLRGQFVNLEREKDIKINMLYLEILTLAEAKGIKPPKRPPSLKSCRYWLKKLEKTK